jgi:hypothetical protein
MSFFKAIEQTAAGIGRGVEQTAAEIGRGVEQAAVDLGKGSRKIVPPMGPDCYNKLCWRLVPHRSGANYAVDRNLDRNYM